MEILCKKFDGFSFENSLLVREQKYDWKQTFKSAIVIPFSNRFSDINEVKLFDIWTLTICCVITTAILE